LAKRKLAHIISVRAGAVIEWRNGFEIRTFSKTTKFWEIL
jgi:hypothetical protein